ncbi:lectin subunit alpha-like [Lucilia sericata]|uniref:lectin subunit alpha-like n=1 Tax=Lucilia sericata TaxID=13632 RepID=UPI0018A87D42|nr:lectin subunit alpha-like [Lucilia sericata]
MSFIFLCEIIMFIFIFKINKITSIGQMYNTVENKQYYVNQDKEYTFDNSIIECLKLNMTLVTIETIAEEKALGEMLLNKTIFPHMPRLWIGGLRIPETRTYIWISIGKPFGNWYRGIPDYDKDCVFIGWSDQYQWTDGTCSNKRGYICEHQSERKLQEDHEKLKENLKMEIQKRENLQLQLNNEKELSTNLKEQLQQIKTMEEKRNQAFEIQTQNKQLEQQLQNGEPKLVPVLKNQLQEYQQLIEQNEYKKHKYFDLMFPNIQNAYFLNNIH